MSATPLTDRINARREGRRFVPRPVPVGERVSEFGRRLAERRLPVKEFYNGAAVPDGDGGAA